MNLRASQPPAIADDRTALREMFLVAAPTVATMMSYTLSQFVDGVMVSRLGEGALAAQGNGGVIAFVPLSIMMGVFSVINTYVSQNFGAGRPERGAAYPWNGVWMGAIVWAVILIPFALALRPICAEGPRILAHLANAAGFHVRAPVVDPYVLDNQVGYARILLLGAIFTLSARALSHFFFGMHRPVVVLCAVIAGNVVNLVANWILIFGHLGAPRLGVPGAAIGTVIGAAVEFAIPMTVFLGARFNALYHTRSAWRFAPRRVRDIVRIGWPAGLMLGNEMICWAILMAWLIGSISVADNEAAWIGLRYMHLSFMPAIGMSIAVTAMVGKCIGMGRPDLAVRRTWLGVKVTMVYMGLCAACFVLFRHQLVGVFIGAHHDAEAARQVLEIGSRVMICAAVFQLFDAVGITMIGALRGAGDTVVPGVATAVLSWSLIILGGYGMRAAFPGLGSLGPWIAASAYIIAFALFMLGRFLAGSWKRIKLVDRENLPDLDTGDMAIPEIAALGAPSMGDMDDMAREGVAG